MRSVGTRSGGAGNDGYCATTTSTVPTTTPNVHADANEMRRIIATAPPIASTPATTIAGTELRDANATTTAVAESMGHTHALPRATTLNTSPRDDFRDARTHAA